MSVRGQSTRGRGRGSTQQAPSRGRGASTSRGRGYSSNAPRGDATTRGTFGRPTPQAGNRGARGLSYTAANAANKQDTLRPGASGGAKTRASWQDRWQALTKARERERADAIQRGLIADPDKPRSLSEAITPIGTCQEMCAEYERVQRVVQKDVWKEETDPNQSAFATTEDEPEEARMVKKFRRAAAGLEEQLPSDLRPPAVLKRTCDYLFHDVIGNASSLAHVHHFVWDRTRAIRNDFSIQQVTRPEELQIAIDCYERIARFHIVSLHQLALPARPYSKYDSQQEREQLDRTLLSLMQYYDDSRGRIELTNEAEFRAYCVIFQLQDPIPDLEDRVQSWPRHIMQDLRVRKALEVYMAACNVLDAQGPLKPRASHLVARQDWQRFWTLVASKEVSYLMACVAEVYFNLVRRTVLNALFRTSRANSNLATPDWTIELLCDLLAFDDDDEVYTYCEKFGFTFKEREDGQQYLDLTSVKGKTLPDPAAGIPKQSKTSLVEDKRFGRTIPAIVNGLAVRQAQEAGMVTEDDGDMEDVMETENEGHSAHGDRDAVDGVVDDGESFFMPETPNASKGQTDSPLTNGLDGISSSAPSLFNGLGNGSSFGKPSNSGDSRSVFASMAGQTGHSEQPPAPKSSGSNFDLFRPASNGQTSATTAPSAFDFTGKSRLDATNETNNDNKSSLPGFSFKQPSADESSTSTNGYSPPRGTAPSLFQNLGQPTSTTTNSQQPSSQVSAPSQDVTTTSATLTTPSPDQPVNPFTFGSASGAPAAPAPSFPSQPVQPHFTAPPTSPAPSTTQHTQAASSSSGLRRSSSSTGNKYKPSPLSNSFTAFEDDGTSDANERGTEVDSQAVSKTPASTQISTRQGISTTSTNFPDRDSGDNTEAFEANIARIAQEFFEAPVGGVLDQYVSFHVRRTVIEVKEQLEEEKDNSEADAFRLKRLSEKYGKRWRSVFWQNHLAKTGRERRQRRQRRLHERGSQGVEDGSILDFESMRSGSGAGSLHETRNVHQSIEKSIGAQWSQPATNEQQARPGSKRPMSSHGPDNPAQPREPGHKRMKSTSHVDDRGRITKPSIASHPHADILKRSSFLGFSAAKDGSTNKNTTNSNYFRLKAMGIDRIENSIAPRGTKRRLSAASQTSAQTSPPALRSPSLLGSTPEQTTTKALIPPPASVSKRSPKTNDDDEALFARLKAARQNLEESASFFGSETVKDDNFRRSLNNSQSSNEFDSPSMAKARAEARQRVAQSETSGTERNVPAYRLRESKFVPREHYGKAIERANELRASRSRETSRPESRTEQHTGDVRVKPPAASAARDSVPIKPNNHISAAMPRHNGLNGLTPHTTKSPSQPSFATASNPFSSFTPKAPVGFANHTTQMSSENPFLQMDDSVRPNATDSLNAFATQPVFGSNHHDLPPDGPQNQTIDPSQINQALSNSFGSAHGHGHNHLFSLPDNMPAPPQQDSYLQSQAISLVSDDDDDELEASATQSQAHDDAGPDEINEELLDESTDEDELRNSYGHPNPYAALAHDSGDDEQDWQSRVGDEDGYEEGDADGPNGHAYYEEEGDDEDGVDGDIDENETDGIEDISEDDQDGEDGFGFEDGEHEHQQDGQGSGIVWPAQPQKSSVLLDVGNTAEEAIELSD
ncbi:actin cytoskeleton and mitosis protein [Vermiconidia calcicola]|uniref:Actin cytoskeleton and mitosis protein n=1 Tax=Vermiconidia calcicola TaxID=1690605 RepID=A0ACC3MDK5_9PEZI|nr:actin cytoskeleton and mitosis protein [Vermiconidia calcicola]